jgi:hypothetical protein
LIVCGFQASPFMMAHAQTTLRGNDLRIVPDRQLGRIDIDCGACGRIPA